MDIVRKVLFVSVVLILLTVPIILGGAIWWFDNTLWEIKEKTYELECGMDAIKQYQQEILYTQAQIDTRMVNLNVALKHFNIELIKDMKTFILEEERSGK